MLLIHGAIEFHREAAWRKPHYCPQTVNWDRKFVKFPRWNIFRPTPTNTPVVGPLNGRIFVKRFIAAKTGEARTGTRFALNIDNKMAENDRNKKKRL